MQRVFRVCGTTINFRTLLPAVFVYLVYVSITLQVPDEDLSGYGHFTFQSDNEKYFHMMDGPGGPGTCAHLHLQDTLLHFEFGDVGFPGFRRWFMTVQTTALSQHRSLWLRHLPPFSEAT